MKKQFWAILALVAALALVAGACTSKPPGGTPPGPASDPGVTEWIIGDSFASPVGTRMGQTNSYIVGKGGAGFTEHAPLGYIYTTFLSAVNALEEGAVLPTTIFVVGSVNDLNHGATVEETKAGFGDLINVIETEFPGVRIVPVLQPAWNNVPWLPALMEEFANWQTDNWPDVIDCRSSAGGSVDGFLPANWAYFAQCVDAAAQALLTS